ncbi:MAG TPA: proteasome activator [Acidimicrobiales bacterium]|nr:proteasome activator [Acidimicrobiales bacterium]
MADQDAPTPDAPPTLVVAGQPEEEEEATESVASPAKVLRIGSMTKELLEEVRRAPLDDAGRTRLREIYETSVHELADGLSGDLRDELARLSSPFSAETPSDAELRVAQAQLVGWLEGLFHGIQAAIFSQQMAAQAQLQQMRGRPGLPPGMPGAGPGEENAATRPGTYL